MKNLAILFLLISAFSFSVFAQENKLPPDVTTTIGEIVEAREKVESLGKLVVKYHKTATDPAIKQKYIHAAQLYGETRAAFKAWSEMVRDVLIQKGKKGAEKELRNNPSFAEKNQKAVKLANQFIDEAEGLLYTVLSPDKNLIPFPTFDQLKQLGIDIIKGIFKWKEYKDKQRKEYAQEFYSRVEWTSTWEILEGSNPIKPSLAVKKVSSENSSHKEYFKTARISHETFYAVSDAEWDKLTKEAKEEVLKKMLIGGKEKGYNKIHVLNAEGKTVGFASEKEITLNPK